MDHLVKPSTIAIIPARGGSKRIPNKNTKVFCGKPMIVWTIEAAIASKQFDRVFVSTDCEVTANIAKQHGVAVPFLRTKYTDDFSSVSNVTVHALSQIQETLKESYDIVVQLMANCPLRRSESIEESLKHFLINDYRFQISCFKFGWNNPWWASSLNEINQPTPLFPNALETRSQDLPHLYCPSGAIWIAKTRDLLTNQNFYGPDYRFFPIPWLEAIDIDTVEDLELAESLYLVSCRDHIR